ncbi:MAG: DUF1905 domain-containing protein [Candidatus Nanopelagicales bacterium]
MPVSYSFCSGLWEWESAASWYFLSVPEEAADDIEQRYGGHAGGFGSIRVEVTIGSTTWRTSLFPDGRRRTYVLPVKKAVRRAEGLVAGSVAEVQLTVMTTPPGP